MSYNSVYELIKDYLPPIGSPKGIVLDIGCSNECHLFDFENKNFENLIGIDIREDIRSAIYASYSSKKGQRIGLDDKILDQFRMNFKFIDRENGDIERFNIEFESYEVIICSNLLHLFSDEDRRKGIINKIYKGLKRKGLLYIEVFAATSKEIPEKAIKKISDNLYEGPSKLTEETVQIQLFEQNKILQELSMFQLISELSKFETEKHKLVLRKL